MGASLIAKLLGWTKMPQWALELIVIGVIAASIWYWHYSTFESGVAQQVAKDNAASDRVKADAALATQKLQAKADTAEHAHADEIAHLKDLVAGSIDPVRLCVAPHTRSSGVPSAGGQIPGAEASGAATPGVQPVSIGDIGLQQESEGRDIGPMLRAFGAAADSVSADLREYQNRE